MEEKRRTSRIAILASGGGSNAEAMLKHFAEGSGAEVAEVVWVCTNRKEAGVRAVAQRFGVEDSHLLPVGAHPDDLSHFRTTAFGKVLEHGFRIGARAGSQNGDA